MMTGTEWLELEGVGVVSVLLLLLVLVHLPPAAATPSGGVIADTILLVQLIRAHLDSVYEKRNDLLLLDGYRLEVLHDGLNETK